MFDPQIFSKKSVEITVWQNGETDDSGISVIAEVFNDIHFVFHELTHLYHDTDIQCGFISCTQMYIMV